MAIPLLVAAVALGVLAALIQNQPKPAFAALLVAAVVWAPDAVPILWIPATFWNLHEKPVVHVFSMLHSLKGVMPAGDGILAGHFLEGCWCSDRRGTNKFNRKHWGLHGTIHHW